MAENAPFFLDETETFASIFRTRDNHGYGDCEHEKQSAGNLGKETRINTMNKKHVAIAVLVGLVVGAIWGAKIPGLKQLSAKVNGTAPAA